ncbi:alpha/beta hydrolase [Rhodobacter sp. SGA-6-6]|uniref:alpha/beta hydrolase fold domain-containing protein n=1 Tax=Rhodobacter sp. SGA-6-6 TaxID=2710882 RepID=UPI0013EA6AAE|nr:alpha/beta hydrolase fold domain-containing protein [Rhodobacter sp. SGA-6-6]NGM45555.1 alpha/beta hydrolase [Rhodobacter sp. SGA-6-6]
MTAPETVQQTVPDWIDGDPAELRRWRSARPEVADPALPADVAISALPPEGDCPGGLSFTPVEATGTPVVYFHGGGFVVGSPETHRIVTAWIAHLTRAAAVSIRYRLAPEHPLPAQAQDAVAAIRRQLALHPRLRLMGDSAGAMVALWGHAALTPEERLRIEEAVLFYPGGLPTGPAPSTLDETDGLGPRSLASYHRRLDPANLSPGNPAYDPMAPGFPLPRAVSVLGAGADPVLNQSEALARLPGVRLTVAEEQAHGFLSALPAEAAAAPLRAALGLAP